MSNELSRIAIDRGLGAISDHHCQRVDALRQTWCSAAEFEAMHQPNCGISAPIFAGSEWRKWVPSSATFNDIELNRRRWLARSSKTLLFKRFQLLQHLPDLKCLKHFYPILLSNRKDRNDDSLLTTVTELFESGNVTMAPATNFAPELLVKEGVLTDRGISSAQMADIEFGWRLAKEMGRLDVGQSVAVKGRAVLAVEAVEGTDQCIRRAGELSQSGNFVVVKVAKPQQDMRFDVPTIGISTIETMHQTGATVLALEADRTIMLDRNSVIQRANQYRISIVVLNRNFLGGSESLKQR